MPTLSTLSDDLRLEIVEHFLGSAPYYRHQSPRVRRKEEISLLKSLTLVCHSLYSTCEYFIFRTYHIDLRAPCWPFTKVYPEGSNLESWDEDAIKLRLAHLQRKAAFVREIHITDIGESESSKPEAFPIKFMPELLASLCMLSQVTAIHLITHSNPDRPKTILNADIWNWVLDMKLATARGPNLDTLGLHHGALDTISLFSCQDLTSISITYGQNDDVLFNPTTISLKRININIDMHNGNFTNPLFDFSNVPEAVISVKATFYVEYKMHVPSAWCRHKPNLQRMFAEDLRGYDVARVHPCIVVITRRSKKGWKPSNQVHLEGREAELEEERSMQAYYKMRMMQQFEL
ncbi:hypothetical protein L208DRAFT_1458411 [Tricholoma matsutake]|nr:hypothetical protein L208DRAFT_1458411 [Tricholoma matsutake 945]